MHDRADTPMPICPVCGDEAEDFIVNLYGQVIGCDSCTRTVDAQEFIDMEEIG